MGPANRKLSKRDPGGGLLTYRERGFLPEGLLNYLALLGWSIGGDREVFSLAEMAAAFDVARVNPNPAQFDLKKCEAINAVHLRELDADDLAQRLLPYLREELGGELDADQLALLRAATPLVQERMTVLSEARPLLAFLFVDDAGFAVDEGSASVLTGDGQLTVRTARDALAATSTWQAPDIEQALRDALVEGLGLKPRHAFGPVRVAVTGRKISPPLFESLELLGRERSLARLNAALAG
jgi:glutamyl-tRNA synthetase